MALSVADRSSNKEEQIVHAAEVIGRSSHRQAVFREIYRGKRRRKSVVDLVRATKLPHRRVLDAGRRLADSTIVIQLKENGLTAYEKISFFQSHRDRILALARDPVKRKQIPTKRRPATTTRSEKVVVEIRAASSKLRAKNLTIDTIDSFAKIRSVRQPSSEMVIPETRFKAGIARVLGERGSFKDWGGELRDLLSSRLVIRRRRLRAAFAFKGPGTKGKLTPGKMGKNGDQIQRLFKCPAEVFLVQYQGEIDDAVYEQMEALAKLRSYLLDETVYWCVIDGVDSRRLIEAYRF